MGKTEQPEKPMTRVLRNFKLSIEDDDGNFIDVPPGYGGRQQTALNAPLEVAPRNNMVGRLNTPESPPMNRAARRREAKKKD